MLELGVDKPLFHTQVFTTVHWVALENRVLTVGSVQKASLVNVG